MQTEHTEHQPAQPPAIDSTFWHTALVCPIDHSTLTQTDQGEWRCTSCSFVAPVVQNNNRLVSDFRAVNVPQTVSLNFSLPVTSLDRYELARTHFRAPGQVVQQTPIKLRTKLDAGCQYYLRQIFDECGPDVPILDLGCGNGDNRRFMHAIGFRRVLAVDWQSKGADFLVDAHRLPLASKSFQIVVSTAVFEHLYNPFVAMSEISRILTDAGRFLGGASFWEAWHGSSYFHLTPDGWNTLLTQNGLRLEDLWVGWGIIPSAITHVLVPGHFRGFGYGVQRLVERIYRLWGGEMGVRKFQLRASGSYMVYAARDK